MQRTETEQQTKDIKSSVYHILEAIIVAAIIGGITLYGVSAKLNGQIDIIRSDISWIKSALINHIDKEK